jgi:protein-S-isoprenylcysteine O-methyltransferase Ste14
MTSRLPQLGRRGEGWVALQIVFLVVIIMTGTLGSAWPLLLTTLRLITAGMSGVLGLYLLVDGIARLGRQLTPFPKPVERGTVKRGGAYGLVRHPMYGGVLLLTMAWALVSSPLALLPWALAAAFLDAKRRREEAWLIQQYPEYREYRSSVRSSLVPLVW